MGYILEIFCNSNFSEPQFYFVLFSDLNHFALKAFNHNLYIQYVNLNDTNSLQDIAYRYLRYQKPKLGVYLDMNCPETEYTIEQVKTPENIPSF